MASFANLTAHLNLDWSGFASGLRAASSEVNKFAANLNGKINSSMIAPAKKVGFAWKDVGRIVQGIMVSKVFYGIANEIHNAASAVLDFTKDLEYAEMVYTNLFKDRSLAQEFINVLKDFAAVTPFSFQDSEAAAKRLLAYGIQYKNVMYVMRGVLAASTVQNNPQVIESVSRALGQIYTKGRLMNEELRQLAEAGIPAYEILREKLGLTSEQMAKIGKLAIPAHTAINALVDGMTERFGNVLGQANKTLSGALSNLKDNALMLFSGLFAPLTDKVRIFVGKVGALFAKLREAFELGGAGAVFEALIPPHLQASIRQLIAHLMTLWNIVRHIGSSLWQALGPTFVMLLEVLNMIIPVINMVLSFFARLLRYVTSNAQAMQWLANAIRIAVGGWIMFRAYVLASGIIVAVVGAIAKAFSMLGAVLTFIASHPIWSLLIMLGGILFGLSGAAGKLGDSIKGFFNKLPAIGKVDPGKILQPFNKERLNDIDKFNDKLGNTTDSMGDLAKETKKAGKKASDMLLAFDEVFKIRELDDESGLDLELPEIQIPEIELPPFEDVFADWPSFEEISTDLAESIPDLFTDIEEWLRTAWTDLKLGDLIATALENLGLGGVITEWIRELFNGLGLRDLLNALIGGVLGKLLLGPLGAVIGAFVGLFWNKIAEALGISDVGKIAIPITTVLGAAIGKAIAGLPGMAVGAAIGALIGWLIDRIANGIKTGDWTGIGKPIGIGLGAGIGFLIGGPPGALLGAAIGALVGHIGDMFIDGFTNNNWDISGIAASIGTVLGAGIGFVFGGPAGAVIGAALGLMISKLVALIVENWGPITDWFKQAGKDIGDWFKQAGKDIGDWFTQAGKDIESWVTQAAADISEWASNTETNIATWSANTNKSISDWVAETNKKINDWGAQASKDIAAFFTNAWISFTTWFADTKTALGNWLAGIWQDVSNWFATAKQNVSTWFAGVGQSISNWFATAKQDVSTWFASVGQNISNWFATAKQTVSTWFSNIWNTISNWFASIVSNVSNWGSTIWSNISGWFDNLVSGIGSWFTNLWNTVTDWTGSIANSVNNWWSNLWNDKSANVNIGTTYSAPSYNAPSYNAPSYKAPKKSSSSKKPSSKSYVLPGGKRVTVTTGHALGGIFSKEHLAPFAEDNKAEAVIPLENKSAMQPFVDAISDGITAALLPTLVMVGQQNSTPLQPLYVGTLIADDRGIKELERKMQIIRVGEAQRRGLNG